MSKSFCPGVFFLIMFLTRMNIGFSQENHPGAFRLMVYNVENLFDIYDDSLKKDDDFRSGGLMNWNSERYKRKINSLYKTIVAAGEWEPPEIVAFCEVENRKVLMDLIQGTYLAKYKYKIIHEDSPDPRGIDVCLIYRPGSVENISYTYWIPGNIKRSEFTSRSVLYAKFLSGKDTIHLIVNHWPSRRGGVLAGEDVRLKISQMIRVKIDSIAESSHSGAKIIISGDFNCTPVDQEIKLLLSGDEKKVRLVNLAEIPAGRGLGTYRYMGNWEMIDQIIVSESILHTSYGLYTSQELLTVFKPDFLLKKDPKYPGFMPLSTYRGYKYQGGYSDHLPILLDLKFR